MKNIKKNIMKTIMAELESVDWSKVKKSTAPKRNNSDFLFHVYMGSTVSNNIVIPLKKYKSVPMFIHEVVSLLPKNKRDKKKLKELFTEFNPDAAEEEEEDFDIEDDGVVVTSW